MTLLRAVDSPAKGTNEAVAKRFRSTRLRPDSATWAAAPAARSQASVDNSGSFPADDKTRYDSSKY